MNIASSSSCKGGELRACQVMLLLQARLDVVIFETYIPSAATVERPIMTAYIILPQPVASSRLRRECLYTYIVNDYISMIR